MVSLSPMQFFDAPAVSAAHGTRFLLAGPRPEPGQPVPEHQGGALTAEAEIVHRGRTTLAVEVTVLDEHSD